MLGLDASPGERFRDNRLEVVDVVQVTAVKVADGRVDVPRNRDVDEEERSLVPRRHVTRTDQGSRGPGRGQDDVDVAELPRHLVERGRLAGAGVGELSRPLMD